MLTAPHSVKHTREGSLLFSETGSAVICDYFNKYRNVSCCYKTFNLPDDANYDNISKFKDRIVEYITKNNIKLLMDIHVMSPKSNSDLIIGTNLGHNLAGRTDLLDNLIEALSGTLMNINVDTRYCASLPNTVARFTNHHCRIPTMQLQFNFNTLNTYDKMYDLIRGFNYALTQLEELLSIEYVKEIL